MFNATAALPAATDPKQSDKPSGNPTGEKYMVWNPNYAGISFSHKNDRIIIFQKTYQMLDCPEFLHFLLNPIKRVIAVQACK